MERELSLFRYVDGVNDTPFPNGVDDEQIVINTFTYNAQRMAATPTITASIEYPRCLDNDWDINVYATFNGEKYYIRQIPSSSKSNTSVMYKHDITLYSERFVLENIYFTDIEKKTENGVDVFVKRETTSIIYRFNLMEYVERLNWSLEASGLSYRVNIDNSIKNSEKAKETKDILLEHAYLASAIQEIYNQWEIPFYFEGTNIVVKDCSENITDVTLAYGADESLLSIKKNNANFRKITRISGYGSDKNIPFYYPNWSQKGIIDATPLESNSVLTKDMITITDMKKFDKKMPLNGVVKYKNIAGTQPTFDEEYKILPQTTVKYGNTTNIPFEFIIPFKSPRENKSTIEIKFKIRTRHFCYPTKQEVDYTEGGTTTAYKLYSPLTFRTSFITNNDKNIILSRLTSTEDSFNFNGWYDPTDNKIGAEAIYEMSLTTPLTTLIPKGEYNLKLMGSFLVNSAVANQEIIGTYKWNQLFWKVTEDYPASINKDKNYIVFQIYDLSISYPTSDADNGWYLGENKKINLSDIGISINGTPNDSWNNEGFKQEMISKIPTMPHLMPPLYRDSVGERKFYNAINYPRPANSGNIDLVLGEYSNGTLTYENNNYKDVNENYYDFETEWSQSNQNEHIQEFGEIYPSITNITNANNEPIDEILDVWFDDNDNNEVDEEGKYIHPYFYVRIPQFNGNNGFNLFDHKIVGGEMQVAMTSGDCAACNFKIMVKTRPSEGNETYEDVINPIITMENMGKRIPVGGDSDKKTAGDFGSEDATQQNSSTNSIWLVLSKDNETFNETYPNKDKGVLPKAGDKFVLLNIDMPRSYVLEAEDKLKQNVIQYMSENNSDKWNFQIDFSRIFLEEQSNFTTRLDENCKLNVRYNNAIYNFYVNDYKYEVKANEALPKITVGLVDTITINRGITQNLVDGVMKAINQVFDVDENPIPLEDLFLRKNFDETMSNKMTFKKNVEVEDTLTTKKTKTPIIQSLMYGGDEVMGTGFELKEDENGNSTLTVDNVNVRKKLKATEFVIQQIQFQGGIVIQSAAAMECNNVETLENGNFKCYFDTKEGSVNNQFMLNDLARCQRVGYAPKYYWRKVVEVGSNYIVLSNVEGEYENNSDTPSEGDIIVQMGNTTNKDRQSAIEMTTVGENSPSFIMYSGIKSFSLLEKDTTGIVYHRTIYNEDGTPLIEAYPELYSYGAMYFGDRNKEENFIQFQPNANGTYEMLINAKTTFKGGVSDLGTILENMEKDVQYAKDNTNAPNLFSRKQIDQYSSEEGVDSYIKNYNLSTGVIECIDNPMPYLGNCYDIFGRFENYKQGVQYSMKMNVDFYLIGGYLEFSVYCDTVNGETHELFFHYAENQGEQHIEIECTTPDGEDIKSIYFEILNDGIDNGSFIITKPQLVEGNVIPTTWQPNMEDVTTDVQEAHKAAKDAELEVDKAKERMDNWVADNVFSKLEQQGLEDELRKIQADYSEISTECFKYNIRMGDYFIAHDNIVTQLQDIISELNANETTAIPSDFEANINKYYTQRTAILTTISNKADEVAQKYADNAATNAVDGLVLATENILKDSFLIKMVSISEDKWTYRKMGLVTSLKPNTEYVLSCFKSIANETNNSSFPTATKFTFRIMDSELMITRLVKNIDISSEVQVVKITTPPTITDTDVVLIYNGYVMDENFNIIDSGTKAQQLTMYGVMLAEGNRYSPWKAATPEEEESMYLLKDAIAGSTEIEGGLVLTNLIELKNQSGEVTAGINGLDTVQGGVDNALRFWAGSPLSGSSFAPFRVYDNGEVYAGNFFGFNGAFEINSSNFYNVCEYDASAYIWATIKYELTGSNIYLGDLTAIKEELGNEMICFEFPTKANYVGSAITYFNPFMYAIGNGNDVLPYSICNTNNFMNTLSPETSLSNVGSINKGITDANGNYYRWSLVFSYVPYQIPTAWCQMIAMPIKVASGTQIPSEFRKFIISGSYSGSLVSPYLTATTDCIILRWMYKYLNYK